MMSVLTVAIVINSVNIQTDHNLRNNERDSADVLLKELDERTKDRVYRSEIIDYVEALRATYPNVHIPPFPESK